MKKLLQKTYLSLLLLAPVLAFSQWQSKGPYGGSINAMTKINNTVFAGTSQNGVYMTSDEGATWTAANNGLRGRNVQALVSRNGKLFAGTEDNGVYYSADNGSTWTNRSAGLAEVSIVTLFASTSGIYASTYDGVYFTSNEGLSWTKMDNGIPQSYVVYSWTQVGPKVFAGTYAMGLFESTDGSNNWSFNAGFPNSMSIFVYSLESDGNNIWAGASGGIRYSSDGGLTWSLANNGMPSGEWAKTLEFKSGVLLAGTHNGGIYRSTNNGGSWTSANAGINYWPDNIPQVYSTIKDIEFAGSSTAMAGSLEGMYRSTDDGQNWKYQSDAILATEVTEVAAQGNVVYAATYFSGMFVSEDHGATWTRRNNGLAGPHLLATETQDDWAFAAVLNDGLFRTNDKGLTWTVADNGIIGQVESIKSDDDHLLAITRASRYVSRRLWQSTDHGSTWTEVNTAPIGAFTAVEVRGENIYAGGYNGSVYWTQNNGNSWVDITGYIPTAEVSAILSLSDDEVYVATRGKGVWKITNHGYNSNLASAGLTNLHITDLAYQNNTLFAGTWGSGVFVSQNNGGSWFAVNSGLDNLFVQGLGDSDMKVYVATDAGVYNSPDGMYNNISVLSGISENTGSTLQAYPNPTTGEINLTGLKSARSMIRVYDLHGKVVLEQMAESTTPRLNLQALKAGIYVIKCTGEQDNLSARILVQ